MALAAEGRDLVDASEGERLTGLAKATLYKLARLGEIRSFVVRGRAVRFDRADLQGLVVERRIVAVEKAEGQRA